jgi:hypothetical protein
VPAAWPNKTIYGQTSSAPGISAFNVKPGMLREFNLFLYISGLCWENGVTSLCKDCSSWGVVDNVGFA